MEKLTLIKVGGKIVEEKDTLQQLLCDFSKIQGFKILVHGGGRSATKLASQLGIESKMVKGRRITDAETLKVVTMVYGGLVNKNIVAGLQALGINALGLTGADLNVILSDKRPVADVDYGFVGDVKRVNAEQLALLIKQNIVPVMAPLTHGANGCFEIPASKWKKMLKAAIGKEITVSLVSKKDGIWMGYQPFKMIIAAEPVDGYIAYRLIAPGYSLWSEMGIYQRDLENYDQTAILENKMTDNGCMNCHSFCMQNPDKMLFHMYERF